MSSLPVTDYQQNDHGDENSFGHTAKLVDERAEAKASCDPPLVSQML